MIALVQNSKHASVVKRTTRKKIVRHPGITNDRVPSEVIPGVEGRHAIDGHRRRQMILKLGMNEANINAGEKCRRKALQPHLPSAVTLANNDTRSTSRLSLRDRGGRNHLSRSAHCSRSAAYNPPSPFMRYISSGIASVALRTSRCERDTGSDSKTKNVRANEEEEED